MAGQVEALKQKRITKPVVAWVSGTCAKLFKSEVQFGHAGAKSGGQAESAQARTRPHAFRCHNLLKAVSICACTADLKQSCCVLGM